MSKNNVDGHTETPSDFSSVIAEENKEAEKSTPKGESTIKPTEQTSG